MQFPKSFPPCYLKLCQTASPVSLRSSSSCAHRLPVSLSVQWWPSESAGWLLYLCLQTELFRGKYLYQMCKRDGKEHCERRAAQVWSNAHSEGKVQRVTVEWGPGETRGKWLWDWEQSREVTDSTGHWEGRGQASQDAFNDTAGQLQGCSSHHWILHLVVQCCIYIVHTLF